MIVSTMATQSGLAATASDSVPPAGLVTGRAKRDQRGIAQGATGNSACVHQGHSLDVVAGLATEMLRDILRLFTSRSAQMVVLRTS